MTYITEPNSVKTSNIWNWGDAITSAREACYTRDASIEGSAARCPSR